VDFALTPEQELVRQTAREFCDREIVPFARDWDRTETMDRAIVGKLAEIGFLGAALPAEHGGMGLDTVSYCLVMEELGRADSSVRGIVSVNNGLVGKTIAKWGSGEQCAQWLPRPCDLDLCVQYIRVWIKRKGLRSLQLTAGVLECECAWCG